MLLFPDSFHSNSLDLDYWGMARGSGAGMGFQNQCETSHATCICAFSKLGQTSPSFPQYHQEYSCHYFQFWGSGEGDTVLRWKWIQKLLDITVLFLLLNVCLLLGCQQSFYSHSKPFMLISHMDTLNLKNSWVKRFEKRFLFPNILGALLSICGYL